MKLTFLGTGTAAPDIHHRPSSIVFSVNDELWGLLDIGAGSIHSLAGAGFDPIHLKHVFLSHFHSDHVSDLIMLLHSNNAIPGKIRTDDLHLYGPEGLKTFVKRILDLFPETIPETYHLIIHECPNGMMVSDSLCLYYSKTGHTENSIGFSLEFNNFRMIYTGDCAYSESLVDFCKGAEILITECSFLDERGVSDHLTVSKTAELASKSDVSDLVIIHRYPETISKNILPEISQLYHGNVFIPNDMETINLF